LWVQARGGAEARNRSIQIPLLAQGDPQRKVGCRKGRVQLYGFLQLRDRGVQIAILQQSSTQRKMCLAVSRALVDDSLVRRDRFAEVTLFDGYQAQGKFRFGIAQLGGSAEFALGAIKVAFIQQGNTQIVMGLGKISIGC
jgi:hypothetical protein